MSVLNRAPSARRGRVAGMSQEEHIVQMLKEHKKWVGEVILVKIDERTSIELPASMSREQIEERKILFLENQKNKNKRR